MGFLELLHKIIMMTYANIFVHHKIKILFTYCTSIILFSVKKDIYLQSECVRLMDDIINVRDQKFESIVAYALEQI